MTILEEETEEFTEHVPQKKKKKKRGKKMRTIYIPGLVPGNILKLATACWSSNQNELISNTELSMYP
jgi:hypothetical protein